MKEEESFKCMYRRNKTIGILIIAIILVHISGCIDETSEVTFGKSTILFDNHCSRGTSYDIYIDDEKKATIKNNTIDIAVSKGEHKIEITYLHTIYLTVFPQSF